MDGCPEPRFDVRVLASGSSGNCVFFRAGDTRVLLDAGISRRRIRTALWEIDEDLDNVDAILVTHEHGDHIHALPSIMAKHPEIPVHCTAGTAARVPVASSAFGAPRIDPTAGFQIGSVVVTPFPTSHDAAEPVGFRLDVCGFSLAYVTDLGVATDEVERVASGVQVLLLEANYDEKMLWNGPYPKRLKQRVASRLGHLSNLQAAHLLERLSGPSLETVILGHLSAKNNDPALAVDTVAPALARMSGVRLIAAERTVPGDLMTFGAGKGGAPPSPIRQLAFDF